MNELIDFVKATAISLIFVLLAVGATWLVCERENSRKAKPERPAIYVAGDVVKHKGDGKRCVVLGAYFMGDWDGTAQKVWKYEVRFPTANTIEHYAQVEVYEFELEPKQAELEAQR